jgi:RluA family pseudouridine synthase
MILTAIVGPEQAGLRLDAGAALLFPQLSKARIRTIIDWGGCTVAGTMVRVASRTLREGEEIVLGVMEPERCQELTYTREELLYEDKGYVAVNKAAGVNSQRTPYQLKGTAEYAVTLYLKSLGLTDPARVVHRLDRGTSGVMFFPKHKQAATHISYQLKTGGVEKVYWALIAAVPDEESWRVDAPIAKLNKFRYGVALPGKESTTLFRVIAFGKGATLVEARPLTGRTHQIRVHLTHCGFPIVGDAPYGGAPAARMMLHCRRMAFRDLKGQEVRAEAPVDEAFAAICREYGIDVPQE